MTKPIFTPKSDDIADMFRVATVKQSSGYLAFNGFGEDALKFALADAEARGGRVIVTQATGSKEWVVQNGEDAPTIPDALPEDFK